MEKWIEKKKKKIVIKNINFFEIRECLTVSYYKTNNIIIINNH